MATSLTPIVLPGDPTANLQAATKQYVDNHIHQPSIGTASPNNQGVNINAAALDGVDLTVTTACTINVPTNGYNGKQIQVTAYGSAEYTVNFHASLQRLDGIDVSYVVSAGKKFRASLRRSDLSSTTWTVEAAAVTQ